MIADAGAVVAVGIADLAQCDGCEFGLQGCLLLGFAFGAVDLGSGTPRVSAGAARLAGAVGMLRAVGGLVLARVYQRKIPYQLITYLVWSGVGWCCWWDRRVTGRVSHGVCHA
ncbi:Uncharacterised protein [Mycobacteroides abscessus subsp. abscessus]|nr:Uncharacterised protein [Mycobacteroides abscessus subsp. abscessus]